MDTWEPQHRL